MRKLTKLLLLASVACFSACAQYDEAKLSIDKSAKVIKETAKAKEESVQRTKIDADAIVHDKSVNLGGVIIYDDRSRGHVIPDKQNQVDINLAVPLSLKDIVHHLSLASDNEFILNTLSLSKEEEAAQMQQQQMQAANQINPNLPHGNINTLGQVAKVQDQKVLIGRYSGRLDKLLDRIASEFNVSWERNPNGQISVNFVETKVYTFAMFQHDTTASNKFSTGGGVGGGGGNSGGSGGGGGGSSQSSSSTNAMTIDIKTHLDPWKELGEEINALFPKDKYTSVNVMPSAGKVVVTARPSLFRRNEAAMESLRRDAAKVINVDITLYAVQRDDSDNYALNLSKLQLTNGSGFLNVDYTSPTTALVSTVASLSASVNSTKSVLNNSTAIAQALTTIGHTKQLRQVSMMVQNNQIVSMHSMKETAYVESIGIGTTTNGTSGTSNFPTVMPGTTTSGFSTQVSGKIIDSDHISVEYRMDMSVLDDLKSFSAGGGYNIQQPIRSLVDVPSQIVTMKSGQTLIAAGSQISDITLNKMGLGDIPIVPLGGDIVGENSSSTLVIVITPTIIDTYRSDQDRGVDSMPMSGETALIGKAQQEEEAKAASLKGR